MKNEKQICIGWTSRRDFRNNLPCGNRAQPGSLYCKRHDPKVREARDAEATAKRLAEWKADAENQASTSDDSDK